MVNRNPSKRLLKVELKIQESTVLNNKIQVSNRFAQKMVKTILNLEAVPKPDDVADALAVAICHTNNSGYNNIMERLKKI